MRYVLVLKKCNTIKIIKKIIQQIIFGKIIKLLTNAINSKMIEIIFLNTFLF